MSWKEVNRILGLASIDSKFCQELLQNPSDAIRKRGFQLTEQEFETISEIGANDLYEFSQIVLTKLGPGKE